MIFVLDSDPHTINADPHHCRGSVGIEDQHLSHATRDRDRERKRIAYLSLRLCKLVNLGAGGIENQHLSHAARDRERKFPTWP